jgi:hypothetical protein
LALNQSDVSVISNNEKKYNTSYQVVQVNINITTAHSDGLSVHDYR